jgi:phosphoenolpyruvate carboxykinase (ATP)
VIQLSPTAEPEIYACTGRFGTILENVTYDPVTRMIDLDDESITENTRASYPLDFIANAVPEKMGGHPRNIILLTCDASGVMPPIARLSVDQALYQFISGYTSKIAGTEVGLSKEPEMTFSTCFGPFIASPVSRILKRKILKHGGCWLVNTGWIGGPYGGGSASVGTRGTAERAGEVAACSRPIRCSALRCHSNARSAGNDLNPAGSWPDKSTTRRSTVSYVAFH